MTRPQTAKPPATATTFSTYGYPVAREHQHTLIDLWRSAWTRTDYDFLESLYGDYAATLSITSVVAEVDGIPAATASVLYAADSPETGLIANVVCRPDYQGRGFGQKITELCVEIAFAAGCDVVMLGSKPRGGNVYERCGFRRVAGAIMRHDGPSPIADPFAPGQATTIRPGAWGDMPGFVRLIAEPLTTTVLDYPRAILSVAAIPARRCVSAFTSIWEDVARQGGVMLVLASGRRILGFGTLTPGPGPAREHTATVDFALHDAYADAADALVAGLLDEAAAREITTLEAHIAVTDAGKRAVVDRAGFTPLARLLGELRLPDGGLDVVLLRRTSTA